eukprot:9087843-Pyramimonas_sp.AAC.1
MRLDWAISGWEVKGVDRKVMPHDVNGEQKIFRAKVNQRRLMTASGAYAKSFLLNGIVTGGVAGSMWLG